MVNGGLKKRGESLKFKRSREMGGAETKWWLCVMKIRMPPSNQLVHWILH